LSTHPPDRESQPDDTLVDAPPVQQPPAAPAPAPRRGRSGLVIGVVLSVIVVLAAAAYGIGYFMAGDKLPKNAEVSGVRIGGLTQTEAVNKLSAEVGPWAGAAIPVTIAGQKDAVDPGLAGLSVNFAKSVAQAGGGKSLDPRQIWRVLTAGSATEVVVDVDEGKLAAAVAALSERWNAKPADASLSYDGAKVVQRNDRNGVDLEEAKAATAIEDAYLQELDPIPLAVKQSEPEITRADVDEVVKRFAQPAVSGPITVKAGQAGSFTISPAMIASAITFAPKDGTLAPSFSAKALANAAASKIKTVELKRPKNATVRLVDGKPKVIAAVNGTVVSEDNLAKAVEPALTKSGAERTVTVELTGADAEFTTQDAQNLGIKQVTGEFTTAFPYANYRNVNIGRAAELINGTLLKPGDIFSLNDTVGERTEANGFTEGNIIKGGKFRLELGGGVSQSATTTYNAMFFAGLQDIEHRPHTLFIDRYPPGREATVAWPSLDLKFKNDTKYGVLVQANVKRASPGNKGSITVKMWSTKTYDKIASSALKKSNFTTGRDVWDASPECQEMSPVQGFDVNYSRMFYRGGQVVKTENFQWRYGPTDRVRCGTEPN
jgi:vancomycin resistance protein YoaR